jgi:hypothetical protein
MEETQPLWSMAEPVTVIRYHDDVVYVSCYRSVTEIGRFINQFFPILTMLLPNQALVCSSNLTSKSIHMNGEVTQTNPSNNNSKDNDK